MSKIALYRKYRPMTFADVAGQENIVKTLSSEVVSNSVSHAYLFCGTRGTGKTTLAKILAKAVNCENLSPNGDPCCKCSACKSIQDGNCTDVLELDAASNNSVDNIRDIRNNVEFLPTQVKKRVYIIDEVHMLSMAAFNALLKTLEEPPEHAIFILATTENHKVPVTISSRCQRFTFSSLTNEQIEKRLEYIAKQEKINIEKSAIEKLAVLADGAMRDAVSLLEQVAIEDDITAESIDKFLNLPSEEKYNDIIKAIINKDEKSLFEFVDAEIVKMNNPIVFASNIFDVCKKLYRNQIFGGKEEYDKKELLRIMQNIAEIIGTARQIPNPKKYIEASLLLLIEEVAV